MNGNQVRSYADFEVWINRAGAVPNEFPVQVFVSPDGYGEGVMALDVHTEGTSRRNWSECAVKRATSICGGTLAHCCSMPCSQVACTIAG